MTIRPSEQRRAQRPGSARISFPRISSRLSVRIAAACLAIAQIAPAWAACTGYVMPGVNVSGGEFKATTLPGRYGYDYIYPGQNEVSLMKNLNLKLMRVPFLWERVQSSASTPLIEAEMVRLDAVINLAQANGLTVILDVHNYGMYNGGRLGTAAVAPFALADLWQRIATRYMNNSAVVFDMMNEPHDIPADTWAAIVRQTLDAIRSTGATNLVMIPGTNWDGAQSWFSPYGPMSNATALLPIARSDPKVIFEVHQYMDTGYSGTSDTCTNSQSAISALSTIGSWARTNNVKLFLGEIGVSQRSECVSALDNALAVLQADKDIWYGWTYWSAGAWSGTYMFNVESASGQAAQGSVLNARATTLNSTSCSGNGGGAAAPSPKALTTPLPAIKPILSPAAIKPPTVVASIAATVNTTAVVSKK